MAEQAATIVERHPGVVVVRVQVEHLDEGSFEAVRAGVAAAGLESPGLPVAMDMARVSMMPSMTLGGLIQLTQQFRSRKQRLVLVNLQQSVREVLVVTKLDRLFEIRPDLSALMGGGG